MSRPQQVEDFLPLPASVMHIVVALADGEKHGYAILRDATFGRPPRGTGRRVGHGAPIASRRGRVAVRRIGHATSRRSTRRGVDHQGGRTAGSVPWWRSATTLVRSDLSRSTARSPMLEAHLASRSA